MNKLFLYLSAFLFCTLSTQAAKTGKQAYEVSCKECHGDNGAGGKDFGQAPNITILDEYYFRKQFTLIREKKRKGPGTVLMNKYLDETAKLSPEELEAAIVYALELPPAKPNHKNDFGDATKGAVRYALCAACHGPGGRGNINPGLPAPRIAGQSDFYVFEQLKGFKEGHRDGDTPSAIQMKGMAKTLENDEAIKNIAAYIRTFKLQKD
ncbi:MAG: c-type cytochrome [Lentisphaeraceae bacterium]|nr:c-type cytochrome [Lentisphaeraceae bacterium]